ncbi:ABC transporter substrate-binding protein [Anaerovirgula multivorans]|uniref:ABC transporter substrate-binding protein n=1 Tax=Anaerovirgula multivorans TaxID=312168 RepID=UPI000B796B66|nr:ABC transporter substrate-binding protein [Anaerovirgula multivorans]
MKNKVFKKGSIVLLILLMLTSMVVGCSKTATNEDATVADTLELKETTDAEEPVIIRLTGGDYGYPTPFQHYPRGPGGYKMQLVFDSLLERDENGLIPWMAKEWEISEDGLEYTFTIHEDIQWQDGKPLTMEDIQFSFEYFEKHPPVWNPVTMDGKAFVEKIEIIDKDKIRFTISEKNVTILEKIGDVRMIPKHIWEAIEDPDAFQGEEAVIGCGPYLLTNYNKEHGTYEFTAFENYWGSKPVVEKIQFVPASDEVLAFENNEVDLASIGSDLLARYQGDSRFKIIQNPGFWGYRLLFNMEKKSIFKEKEVRQAIAYGIDQEELVEKVERGAAIVASAGYLPKDHIWYNDGVKKYPFDVEAAKERIGDRKITFQLLTGNSNTEVRIAELIKISLKEVGIDVDIKSVDTKTRDHAINTKDYEVALTGHGGWGSDADILRERYATTVQAGSSPSSNIIPGYENEEIKALAQQQLGETNVEKRKKIIFQLQEIIAEEVSFLPLYNTTGYTVYQPSKYDDWMYMYDHHTVSHSKLSYLQRK